MDLLPTVKNSLDDFFVYVFPRFTSLAAGATQTQNVSIQADSDFYLEALTYTADIAAASQTDSTRLIPNATVLLTDTGSGRQLMSSGIPITGLFGYGSEPYFLRKPKFFSARSVIQAQVVSYEASVTLNIFLMLIGRKNFKLGGGG